MRNHVYTAALMLIYHLGSCIWKLDRVRNSLYIHGSAEAPEMSLKQRQSNIHPIEVRVPNNI